MRKPSVSGASMIAASVVAVSALSAAQAAAPRTYGWIRVFGFYRLKHSAQCLVSGHPVEIALAGSYFPPSPIPPEGLPYPILTVQQLVRGAPTRRVNLARTKDYAVEADVGGAEHLTAGWDAPNKPPLRHYGSGSLSMTRSGMSGSLTADMVSTGVPFGVKMTRVSARWDCAG